MNKTRNGVAALRIVEADGSTLFDQGDLYMVPLYQRAYAWKEKEILQLIHDIYDMEVGADGEYYLGSLIVSRKDREYEVIDGQQRLTTLFILLKCLVQKKVLKRDVGNMLQFSCRDRSNYTLEKMNAMVDENQIEESIREGRDIVLSELNKKDFSMDHFLARLKQVVLFRIEVPERTDLNRYFEIMNTRGEQLEQHDVLKATLMSFIADDLQKAWFAAIWEACSDMTGYVQMSFVPAVREMLFGNSWDQLPSFDNLETLGDPKSHKAEIDRNIHQIIKEGHTLAAETGVTDNEERVRFESIVEFPYFLLHTLRVFITTRKVEHKDGLSLTDDQLDDKKLTVAFDRVRENGIMNGRPISEQRSVFAQEFIKCLLQTRFLFDKFILKREYVNEDTDGRWSIKQLMLQKDRTKKRAYYVYTDFGNDCERETNVMIQACLRVSYTSPKAMHWITKLLEWLSEDNFAHLNVLWKFEQVSENIARKAVKEKYLDECRKKTPICYDKGVDTPHIVFNYLDYLLWKADRKTASSFVFEFRNSVEHWYPQQPSGDNFTRWTHEEGLNNLGNLCIIQRSINSKFSNLAPESKKGSFVNDISKGSLKLRLMAGLTVAEDSMSASENWRERQWRVHEEEMLAKLIADCGE